MPGTEFYVIYSDIYDDTDINSTLIDLSTCGQLVVAKP